MTGHLGDHSGAKTNNCFGQQTLNISPRVLDFMKSTFDPLPNATWPPIEAWSVLKRLIGTPLGPDQIVGLIKDLGLPFQANETLVGEDIAKDQRIDDRFSRQTLIEVSRHQIIDHRNATQSGDGDLFVAKVV